MKDRKAEIGEMLLRVFNKFLENQKKPRRYGLEELLYPSEAHLLMLIGRYPDLVVTGLAEKGAVTKGAVSQMVHKLINKGLIKKKPDPINTRKVVLELTSKGKIAYYSHERMHEEMDRELFAFLKRLKPGQLQVVEEFLVHVESGIDKRK
jgi:DNA-binding MarR family transcriptional regulator